MSTENLSDEQKKELALEFVQADQALAEAKGQWGAAIRALYTPMSEADAARFVGETYAELELTPQDAVAQVLVGRHAAAVKRAVRAEK